MRLLWLRYSVKSQSRYGLFLVISDSGGDLVALKSSEMAPGDIRKIRSNLKYLETADTKQRLDWIRQSCPASYGKAFRRIPAKSYRIISAHQPK